MWSGKAIKFGTAMLLAAATTLTACSSDSSSDSSSSSKDPIRIVMITGITGVLASSTPDLELGMTTAADELNAAGGVDGRKVKLQFLDSKSNPTEAVSQLQKLISSGEHVDAVYAGLSSAEAAAMVPVLTQNKIFSVSQAIDPSLNDPTKYPYHFGLTVDQAKQFKYVAESILVPQGIKRLALMVPTDATGESMKAAMESVSSEGTIQLVDVEQFDPAKLDYTTLWQRVLKADPDGVLVAGTGGAVIGRLFNGRVAAGATDLPMIGGLAVAGSVPTSLVGTDALKNCSIDVFKFTVADAVSSDAMKTVSKAVAAAQSSKHQANVYVPSLGYDMVRMVALAVKNAKGSDASAYAAAFKSLNPPQDYLINFPAGPGYTGENHFPAADTLSMSLVPCSATQSNGFWTS